jgi:predicted ATPase
LSIEPGDPAILQLNPPLRRAGIFDAMRRYFARAAEDRPLVIVWEDLHWTDQATDEFLALLADFLAAHRILMIVTGRPGYSPPAADRAFHTRLALTALSPSDSMAIARELLSVDQLPETVRTLLISRAKGNPFFLEELLRACQESGTKLESLALPDTVQDVIRMRIERLSAAPRQVLDVASVVGREFARRVIDRLADPPEASEQALRELVAGELIYENNLFPELTYVFKHAVTHEVAYEALDPERRVEIHRAIGFALEKLHADRLAEYADVLAHHFSKARAWSKALEYLLKAAKKAANAFAIREALTLYDQVLEAAQQSGRPTDLAAVMEAHRAKSSCTSW